MIELKTKLRKWGNSFGVVVPLNETIKENMKEGEEIKVLLIKKENSLKNIFGSLKGWKINSQKIKDELRKEEASAEKRKWKHLNLTS